MYDIADIGIGRESILTSSKDRTCRLWDASSFRCVGVASGHTDAVGCISVSQTRLNSGSSFFVSGSADKVLKLWHVSHQRVRDARDGKTCVELAAICSVRAHNKDINTVDISPNDAIVASGSQDSSIRLWNSSDLTPTGSLAGHKRGVWCVKFSPVDRCLASAAGDRTVKVWSLIDHSCLRTMQGHTSSVLSLQFVQNGMQLVSGAADGLIRVWTVRNGECKSVLDHHTDKVWALCQLDTDCIVSAGSDASVVFWRDATEENDVTRRQRAEGIVLLEQSLSNALGRKQYAEVFSCHHFSISIFSNIIVGSQSCIETQIS
jgi:U3 small nucleolar RNA-associated protein 13